MPKAGVIFPVSELLIDADSDQWFELLGSLKAQAVAQLQALGTVIGNVLNVELINASDAARMELDIDLLTNFAIVRFSAEVEPRG